MCNKIVLLIDLHTLIHTQNPNTYITTIITSSKVILLNKAHSKSAFKLFFSSILPSLSPFKNEFFFNDHNKTLILLEEELNSICVSKFRVFENQNENLDTNCSDLVSKTLDFDNLVDKNENPVGKFEILQKNSCFEKNCENSFMEFENLQKNRSDSENSQTLGFDKGDDLMKNRTDFEKYENLVKNRLISTPRASHIAGYLFQITRDYNWWKKGEKSSNLIEFRSNLVILFSHIAKFGNSLSEFMYDDESDSENGDFLQNLESFRKKFGDIFRSVENWYVKRDIHCCWVDINFDNDYYVINNNYYYLSNLELFKSCVRVLGWGFSSTDSIIYGNVIIPFILIYPLFGANSSYLALFDSVKPIRTQLLLEIIDTKKKPLVSNCCDLELFRFKESKRTDFSEFIRGLKGSNVDEDRIFLSRFDGGIKNIQIKSVWKCNRVKKETCLDDVIFVRGDYSKEASENRSGFFADKVLEGLSSDKTEFVSSKNGPIWQILLSFLARNGYKAVVSVVCKKGEFFTAILEPFTVHLGLLYVEDDRNVMEIESNQSKLAITDGKLNRGQTLPATNRKKRNVYKDLTWDLFRKAAFEQSASFELEETYFGGEFTISKKLKFLKCWMKQVTKSNNVRFTIQDNAESCKHMEIETGVRLLGTADNSQEWNPLRSFTEPSRGLKLDVISPSIETWETFMRDLPKKIQHGLETKRVDLQILAERLVNLSIYWLSQKNETCIENEGSNVVPGDSHGNVVSDMIKVLLKEPKKLKDKAKNNGFLSSGSASVNLVREFVIVPFGVADANAHSLFTSLCSSFMSEAEVRKHKRIWGHELQIYFRMEILRSTIADSIEASTKRKFVKQICALLEIIQFLVEGGFHGEITLYGYIEKTIKARYFHVLEDVVNKIYVRMDLLPIGDEDYSPIFLLNSEDSSQSWRAIGTPASNRGSSSGENDVLKTEVDYLLEDISKDENSRKVSGVQGRRDKALRYLQIQRVLAPKHGKAMPVKKTEAARKPIKRNERSKRKEVVCETPIFDKKWESVDRCGSVSKALFQDDY